MKNAQKPDRFTFSKLIDEIRDGKFVIPDFQREFEWNPWDVRDLIKSIFLDYYIGTLLLWKGKDDNYKTLSCEPVFAFSGNLRPDYIVLDGQQRLTALHYACFAPEVNFPKRKNPFFFYIDIQKFLTDANDEAFSYDVRSRKWKALLENRDEQYRQHIFPVATLGAAGWDLYSWFKGYEDFWGNEQTKAEKASDPDACSAAKACHEGAVEFGKYVQELHRDYQVSYIELDRDIPLPKVCDIFTQLNSKGIRLDIFDLLNALLKPKNIQLKLIWRDASKRLDFAETDKMNVYVLQVMSILEQYYCSPKYLYYLIPGQSKKIRHADGRLESTVLINSNEQFLQKWNNAVDAIEDSIKALKNPRDYGVISSTFIPYPSIIPAFSALRNYVKSDKTPNTPSAHRKLRKWYWASIFGNRYSSSVESTSAQDFVAMRKWFEADDDKPAFISEFDKNFRNQDLKKETKKGAAIYNAIFNLLVIRGAKDWATFELPEYNSLDDHHIVPQSWGRERVGNDIHSILNRTPLTPATNRNVINDRLPNEYLKEMFDNHDRENVFGILQSHFISPKAVDILLRNPFQESDYYEFIDERQRCLLSGIEDLLIKERLDLEPDLRRMDAQIEEVELAIRGGIAMVVDGSGFILPDSVKNAVEPRLTNAAKKDPGFDAAYYQTPKGMLEYFDLMHCMDVMVSKPYWPAFEGRFKSKEALMLRFRQLGELRNRIRHSRTASDIVKTDGKAAIMWFQEVMK